MKVSNPKKPLNPAKEFNNRFDYSCYRIAPYLIGLFSVILLVLAFYIFIRYGANFTGTEANIYQRLEVMV